MSSKKDQWTFNIKCRIGKTNQLIVPVIAAALTVKKNFSLVSTMCLCLCVCVSVCTFLYTQCWIAGVCVLREVFYWPSPKMGFNGISQGCT